MSPCDAGKLNDFRVGLERRSGVETIVCSLPDQPRNLRRRNSRDGVSGRSATRTNQRSTASLVGTALTAAVTLSHSAVRRARSWDTAERLRLIAMALPPDW